METQRTPVVFQPLVSRPFMHGTRVAGIRFNGPCILVMIVTSSIAVFVGFCMTVASGNSYYCYDWSKSATCGYYTTGVRKAGIVFLFFGGLALIFGALMAFKAHGENKVVRGMVVGQPNQGAPNQLYQTPVVGPTVFIPTQQAYPVPYQNPQVQAEPIPNKPQDGAERPPPYQ